MMHFYLELTTVSNGNGSLWSTALRSKRFNLLDDFLTVGNLTKDSVLSVQPGSHNSGDEELGTVGVSSGIGHGQQEWLVVLQLEVLIIKLSTVDGFTTSTISSGEVTTLEHELRDHSVEVATLVVQRLALFTNALFSSAQSSEVFSSSWDNVSKELEGDSACWLIVDGDIEEDGWVDHCYSLIVVDV